MTNVQYLWRFCHETKNRPLLTLKGEELVPLNEWSAVLQRSTALYSMNS